MRRFLPELIDLIWDREIDPGKVFDLELPLEQAAAGSEAMDHNGRSRYPFARKIDELLPVSSERDWPSLRHVGEPRG